MSCGAGRGRGWLKLSKTSQEQGPGIVGPENTQLPPDSDYFSDVPTPPLELVNLIDKINLLSPSDDGIMFNRKFKPLMQCWEESCPDVEAINQSMDYLYKAAVHDPDFGSRFAFLMSVPSMSEQLVKGEKVQKLYLNHLQKMYNEAAELQSRNKITFRNFIYMFGEYCRRKVSPHYRKVIKNLSKPLICCYEMVLEARSLPDLILLANQIHVNGPHLEELQPELLDEFLDKVRSVLTSEHSLSRECRLWLLFTVELHNYKFGATMPESVFRFYSDQLGADALKTFQDLSGALTIETGHPNSSHLDGVQSQVRVLQISKPLGNDVSNRKEQAGRPILGAGARSTEIAAPTVDGKGEVKLTWKTRGERKNVRKPKPKEGWEHDDRFDNDYS